jgi:Right handed beta helix region/PKD domain/Concanavalin A-like lectin/glucanases superfamily
MAVVISVSNAAQLLSALQHATGGEKIVLQSGNYGDLSLIQGKSLKTTYSAAVTITSADAGHPATITGLDMRGVKNVTFDHVKFDYSAAPGTALSASPFSLEQSSNITISNCEFDGDKARGVSTIDNGFGTGRGLVITGGSNINIVNNDMHDFYRGIVANKINGLTISGNDVHGMSSDGLDFAQVTNVVIDSNHIHDFARSLLSPAHPDMIQFWTTGTTVASSNIKITNNFLDVGAGQPTQSIFMRNELVDLNKAGIELFYKNVLISNNIIRNADSHGITVGESAGLTVSNNSLVQSITQDVGGSITVPYISVATRSTGVSIINNIVPTVGSTGENSHTGWNVHNNLVASIDDPNAANYIGKLFFDALDKSHATIDDFRVTKGSIADTLHLGSLLGTTLTPGTYTGYIDAHGTTGSNYTSLNQTFDVNHVFNSLGQVSMAGAKVAWDYGDGTKGTGIVSSHVYAVQGNYTASATITLSNGTVINVDKTLHVQSSAILDVDFNLNAMDHSPTVNGVTLNSARLVDTAGGGHAIDLNGGVIKYKSDSDFFNNKDLSLVIDFKKDAGEETQGGRLVYFGGSYVITVGADGLGVIFTTTAGSTTLKADNLGLADTDWHRVGLSFSGNTGDLKLFLDGHEVAAAHGLVGAIQKGSGNSDLYLGGPFGGSFGGQIDNLHISDATISTSVFTSGILATPHSDFDSLTQFEVTAGQSSIHVLSAVEPLLNTHIDVAAAPMVSLPHHDFSF